MKNIKITVITVCRNAGRVIGRTLESVELQTYGNIEYIIIDGASEDDTLEIIAKAAERFPIKCVSEPDSGIYDAMNKGIKLATGDYINFLNAGDTFAEKDIVGKVVAEINGHSADIYYGNIRYQYPDGGSATRRYGNICGKRIYYCTGDCINHQAVFAAGRYLKKYAFDTSYRVCGDREWMMRMHKINVRFRSMPLTICSYSLDEGSMSIVNEELGHIEAARCIKEHFPMEYGVFRIFEWCRGNRALSCVLHRVYKLLYIRRG